MVVAEALKRRFRLTINNTSPQNCLTATIPLRCAIQTPKQRNHTMSNLTLFLVQWGLTSLSLWVASYIFSGLRFADGGSLLIAALLLGFANAIVKPLLILFTLPLTVLTMGLFLLVVNALVLMLVSAVVSGFTISSFWTAFFASIFISLFSLFVSGLVF